MKEDIVIKREWVKKAAIIFTVLMIVLTLFSNTIMNSSLPEVYVQSVSAGQIKQTIEGYGTAEAISLYEVMFNQSRTIKEVLVEVGDPVEEGEVLFTLEEEDSPELEAALDAVEDLRFQKEKMLINMDAPEYRAEQREIEKTRSEIQRIKAKCMNLGITASELTMLDNTITRNSQLIKQLEAELEALEEMLLEVNGATDEALRSLEQQISNQKSQIRSARDNDVPNSVRLDDLKLQLNRLKEDYDLLLAQYPEFKQIAPQLEEKQKELSTAKKTLSELQNNGGDTTEAEQKVSEIEAEITELKADLSEHSQITAILRQIEDKEREIDQYRPYLEGASVDISGMKSELKRLEEEYEEKEDDNKEYKELTDKITIHKNRLAVEQDKTEPLKQLKNLREQLDDQLFSLEETKKQDNKASRINDLDYQKLLEDIQKQNDEISELQTTAENGSIKALRSGVIRSLDITAGGITAPNSALAVIETSERGYSVSIPITKQQSETISIGDTAKTNHSDVTATLTQIKTEPNSGGERKILTFMLEGAVQSGEEYEIQFETKGKDYEMVIPKSALYVDNVGSFVLLVTSKKTAFGGRYETKRVSVEVLEQGAQKVAIKAEGLKEMDYVVTASTKPLTGKTKVRMSYQ